MTNKYFIDESGNTGDLYTSRDLLFGEQPTFSLAALGIDSEDIAKEIMCKLWEITNYKGKELKSGIVIKNVEAMDFLAKILEENNIPVFVEAVDKKFYIYIVIINSTVMPFFYDVDREVDLIEMRDLFINYLSDHQDDDIIGHYFDFFKKPDRHAMNKFFNYLIKSIVSRNDTGEISRWLRKIARDSKNDVKKYQKHGLRFYKPLEDFGRNGKKIWILPHVSSMTNLYGRINKFRSFDSVGVNLIHDEQINFGEVLLKNINIAEGISEYMSDLPFRTADFNFLSKAKLSFQKSDLSYGIQVADVVCGIVNGYVKSISQNKVEESLKSRNFVSRIISISNPLIGTGVNFVIPKKDMEKTGFNMVKSY